MKKLRATLTAALTLAVVSALGIGAAAGAEHSHHRASSAAPVSATAPVRAPNGGRGPASLAHGPADPVIPQGFPQELHREERLVDDEREHLEAAPHTLGRFDSGSI
ncbi:hypothetical protein EU811_22005 [Arthrobacter sp. TS-15]|uniref:hypothetical protein n=1 Tax=unclassified Arthrobacter TaxID=235627 RepID=UPI00115F32A3|nr:MULTISPECIES: hypothetical protein [unclassified Arthrobacter]QSZ51399.1 hypothetical protein AYX22_23055 [Arthrobacter sp. D5-1]TQS87781.1 hypothetical protein EU811_22005 [Arthrobacter sp. TS-15]